MDSSRGRALAIAVLRDEEEEISPQNAQRFWVHDIKIKKRKW